MICYSSSIRTGGGMTPAGAPWDGRISCPFGSMRYNRKDGGSGRRRRVPGACLRESDDLVRYGSVGFECKSQTACPGSCQMILGGGKSSSTICGRQWRYPIGGLCAPLQRAAKFCFSSSKSATKVLGCSVFGGSITMFQNRVREKWIP